MKFTNNEIVSILGQIGYPDAKVNKDGRVVLTFDDADTFDYPGTLIIDTVRETGIQFTVVCPVFEGNDDVYELCNRHNYRTQFYTAVAMPDRSVEMRRVFDFVNDVSREYIVNNVFREAIHNARSAFELLEDEDEYYGDLVLAQPLERRQFDELSYERMERIIIDLFGGAGTHNNTFIIRVNRDETNPIAFDLVIRIIDQGIHISAVPCKFVPHRPLLSLANYFNEKATPKAIVMDGKLSFGMSFIISEEVSDAYIKDGCIAPTLEMILENFKELYDKEPRSFFSKLFRR